jgi:hypothetical protein
MLSGWKAKEGAGSLSGEGGGGEGCAAAGLQVSRSSKGTAWTALQDAETGMVGDLGWQAAIVLPTDVLQSGLR